MKISFSRKNQYGIKMYWCNETPKFSVIYDEDVHRYFLRIREDDQWKYPYWAPDEGFSRLSDIEDYLSKKNWQDATWRTISDDKMAMYDHFAEFRDAMIFLGFKKVFDQVYGDTPVYEFSIDAPGDKYIQIRAMYFDGEIAVDYWINGKRLSNSQKPRDINNVDKMVRNIEKFLIKFADDKYSPIENSIFIDLKDRQAVITAAINTRDITKNMVRVKSSNVWSYGVNIRKNGDKTGDVLCQFKGPNGGPGDLYIYYDVPVRVYRRWHTAPSKGHYFWQYIRNNYKYSKLTGDKRGKLKNAIN